MGLELNEVVRRFGPDYLRRHGAGLLPSHRRALADMALCRTAELGGHIWHCPDCDRNVYVYHGCRNRSCPSCHASQTDEWLSARRKEILPCGHFHVTVTIPEELREAFRSNQKDAYGLLMSVSADAVTTLCREARHLGGTPGILSVLHTWTGQMDYHPHVHLLVTAGGISADGQSWVDAKPGFLVPVRALSRLVRRRMREALAKNRPDLLKTISSGTWKREWVANIQPWEGGTDGVLAYLARYVNRIAITNARLVSMDDTHVTFRWKDRKGKRWRTCRVTGEEFLRRYLQHVLPKGFHKVRYYGLWHSRNRALAARARQLLELRKPLKESKAVKAVPESGESETAAGLASSPSGFERCPYCGGANLIWVKELPRPRIRGP